MSSALKDNVYIVTGGSKGFGLAIAKTLVASGARVGLLSRNQEDLDRAVAELGSDDAFGVTANVMHVDDIGSAFDAINSHYGRVDGLINNAGIARPNTVENLVEAEVLMQVHTNFIGTVFCCQASVPLLRGGDNPRIINISSASAHHYDEMSHLSIYAATKAAVERFSRDLRAELQHDGIGVSCIRPGMAGTNFSAGWNAEALSAGLRAWAHRGTHMDIGMSAGHVGEAVVYALMQPKGVAVDLLELRPNIPTPKIGH
ncbi:MAG: SDR family oxidoreductase [Pseudomonadota bacterium]